MKCSKCGKKFYLFRPDIEYPSIIEAENEDEANEELHRRWSWIFHSLKNAEIKDHLFAQQVPSAIRYKNFKPKCEDCRNE